MKSYVVFAMFLHVICAAPKLRIAPEHQVPPSLLTLPSNATSIRSGISDSFSCDNRDYGYYADVDNDCQLFHVCLPVTYSDGRNQTFRWSFICPEDTVFNQEMFTCTRADESIPCMESPRFYGLNLNFGDQEEDDAFAMDRRRIHDGDNKLEELQTVPPQPQMAEQPAVEMGRTPYLNYHNNRKNTRRSRITRLQE